MVMTHPKRKRVVGPYSRGHGLTPEHKEKIRAALTGRKTGPPTAETRAKIGIALKGQKRPWLAAQNRSLKTGKKASEETKQKQRASLRAAYLAKKTWKPGHLAFCDAHGRWWMMRSDLERKVAQRLDGASLRWSYEPRKLHLPSGRIYVPDFWVEDWNEFIEVKGWAGWGGLDKVSEAKDAGYPIRIVWREDELHA